MIQERRQGFRNGEEAIITPLAGWPKTQPNESELDVVDQASEESFPASDAPSWMPISTLGPPHRQWNKD